MTPYHRSTRAQLLLAVHAPLISASLLLSACTNMSGLGGKAEYACKAPQGVQCDSVSGNYHNAIQNNLPNLRKLPPATTPSKGTTPVSQSIGRYVPAAGATTPDMSASSLSGTSSPLPAAFPLRSQAHVLRLWFKPWEDADHDLYDQGYVYIQVDSGRWLIEHAQQRIRDAYTPVRPPYPAAARNSAPIAPSDPTLFGIGTANGSTSPPVAPPRPQPGGNEPPADDTQ